MKIEQPARAQRRPRRPRTTTTGGPITVKRMDEDGNVISEEEVPALTRSQAERVVASGRRKPRTWSEAGFTGAGGGIDKDR